MDYKPEFPDFLRKAVVYGQNLEIWEFGKGALSGKSYSAAVLQSCGVAVGKGKEVNGHETLNEGEFAQQPIVRRGGTFPDISGHMIVAVSHPGVSRQPFAAVFYWHFFAFSVR